MKLSKVLYGFKQILHAWYERLIQFLVTQGFERGSFDKTLFIKRHKCSTILDQIYVDDIKFEATSTVAKDNFLKHVESLSEMSMVGQRRM